MGNWAGRRSAAWSMLLAAVCLTAPTQGFSPRVQAIVPPFGTYVGAAIDWNQWNWSSTAVSSTLGVDPASYVLFTQIPAHSGDLWALDTILSQIATRRIALILTPEPTSGLAAVSDTDMREYANVIAKWEKQGATVIVRFAHEMNGSWYKWGQRPTKFIATFRRFATILRAHTKRATMLWGPNLGTGYPYVGGQYMFNCTARRADCAALDTNGDGQVTEADDMFSPYWPGDDVVDWVGTSLYWWGISYPWGENEVPTPTYFADVLQGNMGQSNITQGGNIIQGVNTTEGGNITQGGDIIQGGNSTQRGNNAQGAASPNFYDVYVAGKDKAMVVTETAALYSLCDKNPKSTACQSQRHSARPSSLAVKRAWWEQVYSLRGPRSLRVAFPNIKIVSWFDIRKVESEAQGNTVDWSVYQDTSVKAAFLTHMKSKAWVDGEPRRYWLSGSDFKRVAWGGRSAAL